jgi:anti-anti-sigma factor
MDQPIAFTADVSASRVKVRGELDLSSSPSIVASVLTSTATELDLGEVTFIDGSGVTALLRLRTARPELQIIAVSRQVQRVLDITRTAGALLTSPRTHVTA